MARTFSALDMFCPDTAYNQNSGTFYGAKIYFCHTTRTSLSTTFADNYSGNTPVRVLSRSSLVLNWTENQWNQIGFDTPFSYNGRDNLLIEICWDSASGGLITATTDPATGQTLLGSWVGATAGSFLPDRSVFRLQYPAASYVDVLSTMVLDQDVDGHPAPGEQVALVCRLGNGGGALATNVQAILTTTSAWCTVTQGAWAAGSLAAGATVSNSVSPYRILVAAGAPLGVPIPLTVNITANGGAYSKVCSVSMAVTKPELAISGFLANDIGDRDGVIEAGERVHLYVCLTNSGYIASNVIGKLSSSSAYIALVATNSAFGTLEHGACVRNSRTPFCFDVSASAPSNAPYSFDFLVSYDGGSTSRLPLTLAVDYSIQPDRAFTWVDTTGGTTVTLGDEVFSDAINLGFSFPFFDQTFSAAYINDNGYVELGGTFDEYENVAIPDGNAPNGIIAPFWDDLDTGTGTVRYKLFGNAPNRYWVAEWNSVPRWQSSPVDMMTFEAILYESGVIKFQYGALSGVNSDGRDATIGIESPTGSNGVQYACDQVGAVTNGQVIVFGPLTGVADTDHDGLPDSCEEFYFGHLGESGVGDTDHDGMRNGDEIYCGTDPNDPSSVLRLTAGAMRTDQNTLTLRWQSIPGKLYNVRQCTNLVTHAWTNANPVPLTGAAGGVNAYTTAPTAWPVFWSVVVP